MHLNKNGKSDSLLYIDISTKKVSYYNDVYVYMYHQMLLLLLYK